MQFGDVLDAISRMSKAQLGAVQRVVNARHAGLAAHAKALFYVGCHARWQDKYGETVYGTVTKVCQKNIKLNSTDGMRWTVSPTLLTKIDALPGW